MDGVWMLLRQLEGTGVKIMRQVSTISLSRTDRAAADLP